MDELMNPTEMFWLLLTVAASVTFCASLWSLVDCVVARFRASTDQDRRDAVLGIVVSFFCILLTFGVTYWCFYNFQT